MNKETAVSHYKNLLIARADRKIKAGKEDFYAYPLLGSLALGLVMSDVKDSDAFYNEVNQAIVEKNPSQVYAKSIDTGSGYSHSRNRIRANLKPITLPTDQHVISRATTPRTQTE